MKTAVNHSLYGNNLSTTTVINYSCDTLLPFSFLFAWKYKCLFSRKNPTIYDYMYKLAKNVHKEKGLLYKKLSILRFLFYFLCHTTKKCYLCRVINEIYLCLGLSNGIFLCCLPLWLSFVIWQWLTIWGTWVRCLLSSEIVDCTDKPSSLHVYRIAHVGEYLLRPFFILIITYQTNHFLQCG